MSSTVDNNTHMSSNNKQGITMNKSTITVMRRSNRFMRFTASVVLAAFTGLILEPAVLAISTAEAAELPAVVSDETKFAKAMQQAQALLGQIEDQLNAGTDSSSAQQALVDLKAQIEALDTTIQNNFTQIGADLVAKGLPAKILKRHTDMVSDYKNQLATFLANVTAIESATTTEERKLKVNQARDHLNASKHKRAHQPFDPVTLPNRSLKPNPNNKPKLKKEEFTAAGLYSNPNQKLAALGDFTFDKLPGASDPAYLAPTSEVTLSPAIHAKAQELNYEPVAIYHWVRNNIHWQPAWGAMQDADLTLGARRGNAFDIASLTIALLRASQIPARYVHGTIQIPEANFRNWAGGFNEINAAMGFSASGGIPTTPVVANNVVTGVRIEHIWVEAAIDFQPSRGAKNRDADSWVEMDPSYKQYEYMEGLDIDEVTSINIEETLQTVLNNASLNQDGNSISLLNDSPIVNDKALATDEIQQHFTDNNSNPLLSDILKTRGSIVKQYPVLPSSLPNRVIVTGARYAAVPDLMQHKMGLAFGSDIFGEPLDPVVLPWAKLNNQKITLSFKPASVEDELAAQSLLPDGEITETTELPSSIPAYLIRVIPELTINDQVVKQGSPMALGEELSFKFQITYRGHGVFPYTYTVPAGSYLSVAVIGGNVSTQALQDVQDKLAITDTILGGDDVNLIGELTRESVLGDMFHAGLLGYYTELDAISHLMGLQQKAHNYLAAGYGTFGYEPEVDYFFGVPRSIKIGGAVMNIPMLRVSGVDSNEPKALRDYNIQVGLASSALEHSIPEMMFSTDPTNPVEAISAVKALLLANTEGQKVFRITQANQATAIPKIHHDATVMNEISAALRTGKEVITHTDSVSVAGWSGAGYIIYDPEVGDGAYKISGGNNGSWIKWIDEKLGKVIGFLSAFEKQLGKLGALGKILKKVIGQVKKLVKNIKAITEIALECNPGFALLGILFYLIQVAIAVKLVAALVTATTVFSAVCGPAAPLCAYALGLTVVASAVVALNESLEDTHEYITEGCRSM